MTKDTHAERIRCLALANSIITAAIKRLPSGCIDELLRLTLIGLDLQAAIGAGRPVPLQEEALPAVTSTFRGVA